MTIANWDFNLQVLYVALMFGVIGSIVAMTFILIRGIPQMSRK